MVVKDALGTEINPGDIVLHAGKGGLRKLFVAGIVMRRWDAGDTIHNSTRLYCHPVDESNWWRPSIIRNPQYLVVVQKRDVE